MKDREPPSIWSGWNLPSAVTILHDPAARLLHSTLWSLSGRSSQTPLLLPRLLRHPKPQTPATNGISAGEHSVHRGFMYIMYIMYNTPTLSLLLSTATCRNHWPHPK